MNQDQPGRGRAGRDQAVRMAAAAAAWLDSLDPPQRAAGWWPSPADPVAERERVRWFYTPTDHGGLPLADQRAAQQQRVMQLLATGLSPAGYATVSVILGWENVLDLVEGFTASWGRARGRDPGMYYLRVFGDPRSDDTWGWRFGGHHVSLNNLIVDGRVRATTPCFIGADPAAAPGLGGRPLRPLAAVEDLARELVTSLDQDQRHRTLLLDKAPSDIIGGNRAQVGDGDQMISLPDLWRSRFSDPRLAALVEQVSTAGEQKAGLTGADHRRLALTRSPRGLPGSEMTRGQRELLGELVSTYTGRVPAGLAPDPPLDDIHIAWAGSTAPGQPHYYRLQGPHFLAEWDNTQRDANHGHSVWRDPEGDFGLDVLARHRATHHAPTDPT